MDYFFAPTLLKNREKEIYCFDRYPALQRENYIKELEFKSDPFFQWQHYSVENRDAQYFGVTTPSLLSFSFILSFINVVREAGRWH